MSTYSEMLKDPRWQRKRLEVLNEAEFTCQHCGATEKTLHVHHMYYERGKKPWEYPDESLRVLCEDCHLLMGEVQLDLARSVAQLDHFQLHYIIGVVKGQLTVDDKRVRVPLENDWQTMGLASFYSLKAEEVTPFVDADGWIDSDGLYKYAMEIHRQRKERGK